MLSARETAAAFGAPMLEDEKPTPTAETRVARAKLSIMRAARDTPKLTLLVLLLLCLLLAAVSARCVSCPECVAAAGAPAVAPLGALEFIGVRGGRRSTAVVRPAPPVPSPARAPLQAAEVAVGVMTCEKFHATRCRMMTETWLQRARRVVFFSDAADQNAPMDAPLIGHAFENTPGERIFAGGNWRAVPILRSMAQLFFSAEAQAALAARGEPPPKWAYMADDDSFAFTSELLAELGKRDPDGKHYLGYAFLAAPHLEGVIPGKRQPTFGNGGAGIAVSRGAMRAAIGVLDACEQAYKWNWPGDTRVAQCLVDAGVKLEWVRSFHSEAPTTIINKKKPPPGSIPIGLTLPPLSFHHVDADALVALERAQIVRDASRPLFYDFGPLALQPVAATGGGAGGQLHYIFGFEVALETKDHGRIEFGKSFGSFALDGGGGGGGLRFVQRFSGDECRDRTASADEKYFTGSLGRRASGKLLGGLSAEVAIRCGPCEGGAAPLSTTRSGLSVCSYELPDPCHLRVALALDARRCPAAEPLRRLGLDAGSAPHAAHVIRDGAAAPGWAAGCARQAPPACATVAVPAGGAANLTLWTRALSGVAALSVARLAVGGGGGIVGARVVGASHALLSGRAAAPVRELVTSSSSTLVQRGLAAVEPAAVPIVIELSCAQRGDAVVRATVAVHEHEGVELEWVTRCE